MLRKIVTGAVVAAFAGGGAWAADDVTLQLKWVTQAQFAGYYVAKEKGYYDEEDLNVTIKPGGPDIAPSQVLAGGGADVMIDWMPSALAAREKGLPLVNIAQPFKSSGHDADLPEGKRRVDAEGLPRQDAGGVVLRQRVSRSCPGWRRWAFRRMAARAA